MTVDELQNYHDAVPQISTDLQGRSAKLQNLIEPLSDIEANLISMQLVRGWIGLGSLTLVYGPSNSGKTFFVIDLAMHIAAGFPYRGQKVRMGQIVYIAAEGGGGIRNRIAAMKKAKPTLCQHDNFYLLPTALDFHAVGDADALCRAMPEGKIALIVVDTMARSMGNGDENSARDTTQFVANLDYIRSTTGATVLVVHHSGKNASQGPRGSSALKAAVDTEITIAADHKITCQKQRDLELPKPLFFDLQSVELGVDSEGDPVTSAIVVEADARLAKPTALKGQPKVALQALDDALRKKGEIKSGSDFPSDKKAVALSVWRSHCDADGLTSGTSTSAPRNAFNRNKDHLIDLNIIRSHKGFVWRAQSA